MESPPTFAGLQQDFVSDGSLRDIYVLDTSFTDWDRLFAAIASSDFSWSYRCAGSLAALPAGFARFFTNRTPVDPSPTLSLWLTDAFEVNCYFFCVDEIEFSFDPAAVVGQRELDRLFEFIRKLGCALKKRVLVAPENLRESPLLVFDPMQRTWDYKRGVHRL
jgi:hypothetical protein